jgi:hypothetical protein
MTIHPSNKISNRHLRFISSYINKISKQAFFTPDFLKLTICILYCSRTPIKIITNQNTFQLSLSPRDNFRPADGIYVAFTSVLLGKQMCTAGATDIDRNFDANPSLNTLIEFSCQVPKIPVGWKSDSIRLIFIEGKHIKRNDVFLFSSTCFYSYAFLY